MAPPLLIVGIESCAAKSTWSESASRSIRDLRHHCRNLRSSIPGQDCGASSLVELASSHSSVRELGRHGNPERTLVILDTDLELIQAWTDAKNESIPEHARELIRYELETTNRTVTIVERRPPWRDDIGPEWTRLPVARLRYTETRKEWSLYWSDQHRRFHQYDLIRPTRHVTRLSTEIDADPTAIFWG